MVLLAPVGPDGGVTNGEEQEDEESLERGGDSEQVFEHLARLHHGKDGERPAQPWRRAEKSYEGLVSV